MLFCFRYPLILSLSMSFPILVSWRYCTDSFSLVFDYRLHWQSRNFHPKFYTSSAIHSHCVQNDNPSHSTYSSLYYDWINRPLYQTYIAKVKVKLIHYTPCKHLRGALDRDVWLASRPGHAIPLGKDPFA